MVSAQQWAAYTQIFPNYQLLMESHEGPGRSEEQRRPRFDA
jgi:hypothetical protein